MGVTIDYTKDMIYPIDIPDPSLYAMVKRGSRGANKTDLDEMVQYLIAHRIVCNNGRYYVFDGCVYKPTSEETIRSILHKGVDIYTDIHQDTVNRVVLRGSEVIDVLSKVRAVSTIDTIGKGVEEGQLIPYSNQNPETNMFDETSEYDYGHLIPFKNGIFNASSGQLLPFTPHIFITH